jgi:hypothetical protein
VIGEEEAAEGVVVLKELRGRVPNAGEGPSAVSEERLAPENLVARIAT